MLELATVARRWRTAEERLHEAIWDRYQQGWKVYRISQQAGVSRYYVEHVIKNRQNAAAAALEDDDHRGGDHRDGHHRDGH